MARLHQFPYTISVKEAFDACSRTSLHACQSTAAKQHYAQRALNFAKQESRDNCFELFSGAA